MRLVANQSWPPRWPIVIWDHRLITAFLHEEVTSMELYNLVVEELEEKIAPAGISQGGQ